MSFLYREAGRILEAIEKGKASLKTLTLGRANMPGGGKGKDQNGPKRKLYAIVAETLRFKPLLDRLVLMADPTGTMFSGENVRQNGQAYIMLYDLVLGKGSINGGGTLKRHLMQYKVKLQACLLEAKKAEGLPADAANETLLPMSSRRRSFPRYARVNLMTCPDGVKGVAATLRKEGFEVQIDGVVPSLLVLPPGTDLHAHPMVEGGRLVLQDKSSCFAAEALLGEEAYGARAGAGGPWKGGDVIDACAAPGNKTTHAASLLSQQRAGEGGGDGGEDSNKGSSKVFAFDKDPRRLALMRQRVEEAGGAAVIETHLQDFLEVDVTDERFSKVTSILVDPSCSGSGIVSAPGRLHENPGVDHDGPENSRLSKLAAFQLKAVHKAMSFPQVQRVCYSTCSIHVEENESVVSNALKFQPAPPLNSPPPPSYTGPIAGVTVTPNPAPSSPIDSGDQEKSAVPATALTAPAAVSSPTQATAGVASESGWVSLGGYFKLAPCLSRWPRRGLRTKALTPAQTECMVRTDPLEDRTNGFFVAVFERETSAAHRKRRKDEAHQLEKKKRKQEKMKKKTVNKKMKRKLKKKLGRGVNVVASNVEGGGVGVKTHGGEEMTKS